MDTRQTCLLLSSHVHRTSPTGPPPASGCSTAADELFYAEGVHTVGIDRVIERAGVAKATLYSAFGSKDELIRAYLERPPRRAASSG